MLFQRHQPEQVKDMGRDFAILTSTVWEIVGDILDSYNQWTRFSVECFCFYLKFENFLWNNVFVSEFTRHYLLEDLLLSLAWHSSMDVFSLQVLITVGVLTLKIPALPTLPFLPWWLPSANKAQFIKSSSQRNYIPISFLQRII